MRELACLDEAVRLAARLGDSSPFLLRLGTSIVRCGVDRQRDAFIVLVGDGLRVRTSHDRPLPLVDSIGHRGFVIDEVRERVVGQTKDSASEVKPLALRSTELRREIANLAEAIAMEQGATSPSRS